MALLPQAKSVLQEVGGGVGSNLTLVAILSVMQKGPVGSVALFQKASDIQTVYGLGEGLALAQMYLSTVKQQVLFGGLSSAGVGAAAAAIKNADVSRVLGTSAITFTGTPFDDEDIVVLVNVGGTIGSAGIQISVSRDGGILFSGQIRLGTATTYVIPNTGITVNFGAGTLLAGDTAECWCDSAKPGAADIQAGFTAIANSPFLPRIVVVCGDIPDQTHLLNITGPVSSLETVNGRYTHVICSARDFLHPAIMQNPLNVQTIAFAATTLTRSAGSFVTDGFQVGQWVYIQGSLTPANNGFFGPITAVTATILTLGGAAFTVAAAASSITLVATEPKVAWKAAVEAVVGATPSTQVISHRTVCFGGRATKLDANGYRKRRPAAWPFVIAEMQHDIQVSPAQVDSGPLAGWQLATTATATTSAPVNTGNPGSAPNVGTLPPLDYDERADGGLLAYRVACLCTVDDFAGIYVALPVTLDNDNAPLSRLPVGLVGDLYQTIVKQATTLKLSSRIELNNDGTAKEKEAQRIEKYVVGQLSANLLTRKAEGQRASAVDWAFPRNIDLRTPGTLVNCEGGYVPLGYLEQINTNVYVRTGS